ncbi:putative CAMK family protein kinase [Tritrichomonas foetus]|uniref:CAMK family protein kinase n=1 Tax=Tritrichomonas foetus TaxID=1144522 RepID=A0A1J4JS23_9EUKA|nr:putative CAMK family protein kinase [Tritrichomonas foetus]|eukprot:OHT00316.1 putative CAMK family protein kinase [Tritrichomonas foetus]
MPDFPDPIKDLIRGMLCVDVSQRITLKQIKQHPAFRLLMPQDYIFPSPLPQANITEPIDPSTLSPDIMTILHQIGFDNDNELRTELMADHHTKAKQFLFLVLRRVSFYNLPWGGKTRPAVNLDIDPKTAINFDDPFLNNEKYQTGLKFEKCIPVEEIDKKHEVIVTEIQKYLTENHYNWFYPHDLLILIRKEDESLDMFIRFEYLPAQKIMMKLFLVRGDEAEFDKFASDVIAKVK